MEPHNTEPFTQHSLNNGQFDTIKTLVYQRFGIHLTEEKRLMISIRLGKILRNYKFRSFEDLLDNLLHRDAEKNILSELINQVTTNHTFFYRESAHFDCLTQKVLPEITRDIEQKGLAKDLRVWSAGCATGEEAYTLAMMMMEFLGSRYYDWRAGVLATDISEKALIVAKKGEYITERIEQLPDNLLKKYCYPVSEELWKIRDTLKKEIIFRRFNLMNEVYPFQKKFHIIFCRNVMIYFDKPTREKLVNHFYQWLEPSGYLFIGHSETLGNNHPLFQSIQPAVYRFR